MGETIYGMKRTHMCTELSEADVGKEVAVMGWVHKRRNLGSLLFVDLRDRTGLLQIVFGDQTDREVFDKSETIRNEYVIAVKGEVAPRAPEAVNPSMKTGRIEILATELRILSSSETPPFI